MPHPQLPIRVRDHEGALVVGVGGELDLATVPTFEETLEGALSAEETPPGRLVVLDLLDLGFMDSSGLGAILALEARHPEVRFKLVVGEGVVDRVLRTTAMHKKLDIVSSVAEAVS
jgi:anti-anti-sigma factor